MKSIGKRIKQVREYRKWNQTQLAKKIQSHAPEVSHWENGKRIPGLKTAEKLAKALEVSFEWLLTGQGSGFLVRKKYSTKLPAKKVEEEAKTLEMDDSELDRFAFETEVEDADFRLFEEEAQGRDSRSFQKFMTQIGNQDWVDLNHDYFRSLKFIFEFGTDEDIQEVTGILGKIDLRIKKRIGRKRSPNQE
jgi:transcriptional regulator with XRE-family HTH domain